MRIIITLEDLITDKITVIQGSVQKVNNPCSYRKWHMDVDIVTVNGEHANAEVLKKAQYQVSWNSSSPTRKGVPAALLAIYKYEGQMVEVVG